MSAQSMDVFSLRDAIVDEYKKFSTSFTKIFLRKTNGCSDSMARFESERWRQLILHTSAGTGIACIDGRPKRDRGTTRG